MAWLDRPVDSAVMGIDAAAASYAAVWRERDGAAGSGRLVLEADGVVLRGASRHGQLSVRKLDYADLVGVRVGRAPQERLNGRPTLVLERANGVPLRIGILGVGLLSEVADLLALLSVERAEQTELVAVVVPLKEGVRERVRGLIEEGPPFDPQAAGLERHQVFLGEREVIFQFEGREVYGAVERLIREPGLWKAAAAWTACLAGRPRLVEPVYTWTTTQATSRRPRPSPPHPDARGDRS